MTTLTLSVDLDVLHKAQELASREHTTVNALVREFLTDYVNVRSQRLQAIDALDTLDTLADSINSCSTSDWTRASLHEQ